LDVETLFFVEASLLFLFGLTMIVTSLGQQTSQRSDYWFAASNIIGAAGLLLHALFPHPLLFTVLVPNVLLFIELSLLNKAIAEFVQHGRRIWLGLLVLSAAMTIASVRIVFLHLNPGLIVNCLSIITITTATCSAVLLFRFGGVGSRTASRIMGTLFALYALNNLIHMVDGPQHLSLRFYHLWFDRTVIAVMSFGYILMTAARLRNKLEQQANTDHLTGTLNRRALEHAARMLVTRKHSRPQRVSALMLDLDNFKGINDTFGHHAGDLALQTLADCLRETMRTTDLIARLGGDEFLVIMSGTTDLDAHLAADRLRSRISAVRIQSDRGYFRIRASIGVTSVDGRDFSVESLIRLGDHALYAAKFKNHQADAFAPMSLAELNTLHPATI